MLRALTLVQNYDWVWQQRGCVISSHFQQISLITGYVLKREICPPCQKREYNCGGQNTVFCLLKISTHHLVLLYQWDAVLFIGS